MTLSAKNRDRLLLSLLLLLLALWIRWQGLEALRIDLPRYDQDYYRLEGMNIAEGRGFVTTYINRPMKNFLAPVFPAVLAVLYRAAPPDSGLDRAVNLLWDLFLTAGLFVFARRWFGRRAGWIAAAIAVFWFPFVQWSRYLITDSLFAALLVWGAYFFYRSVEEEDLWGGFLAGLLFGLAGLTKSNGLTIVPFLAVWGFFFLKAAWRRRVVFLVVFLAGVLMLATPWTARNHFVLDDPSPLQTISGVNLWLGNHPESRAPSPDVVDPDLLRRAYWGHTQGEVDWNARMKAEALAFVRRDPELFARRLIERGATMFSLGALVRPVERIRGIPLLSFGPVLILALIGFVMMLRRRRWRELSFALPFLVGGLGPGLVMMGIARHRMPFDWIFILPASYVLSRLLCRREEEPLRDDVTKTRRVVLPALIAVLVLCVVILMNPMTPAHDLAILEAREESAMTLAELTARLHATEGEIGPFVGERVALSGRLTTPMPRSDGSVSYYFVSDDDRCAADLLIRADAPPEGARICATGRVTGLSRAVTIQIELLQD